MQWKRKRKPSITQNIVAERRWDTNPVRNKDKWEDRQNGTKRET